MTPATPDQRSLLDELEARQDEVLRELDQLNERIESLINECLGNRGQPVESSGPSGPTSVASSA